MPLLLDGSGYRCAVFQLQSSRPLDERGRDRKRDERGGSAHADQGWIRRLKHWQDRAVSGVYGSFRIVLAVLAILTVAVVALFPLVGWHVLRALPE